MRLAGTLDDQHDAATVVDYLLTQDIGAKAERNGEAWQIWILDEDRVDEAKQELKAYLFNREDPKYRTAAKEADRLRRERVDKALEARRNVIRLPRSAAAMSTARRPLTMLLFALSTLVFMTSGFGKKPAVIDKLQIAEIHYFADGSVDPSFVFPNMPDVRRGEYWRLLSPMLLHFTIMHFVGNMYWLFEFGSQIEGRRGSLVFAALVIVSSLACNLGQYWLVSPSFGGMSGVNYGLFGYLLVKTKLEPRLGFVLPQSTIFFLLVWFVLGMYHFLGPVANEGHMFGLVAGMVFAAVPTMAAPRR